MKGLVTHRAPELFAVAGEVALKLHLGVRVGRNEEVNNDMRNTLSLILNYCRESSGCSLNRCDKVWNIQISWFHKPKTTEKKKR